MEYIETGLSFTYHMYFIYFATVNLYLGKRISVKFSHLVLSYSLCPHRLQQVRLPCPSLTPRACSNSHPSVSDAIQPSHPLSSLISSCLQSFATSGFFPMALFFASGSQNTGASASASVLRWIFRTYYLQGWMGWPSYHLSDSQESSPTP